MMLRNFVAKDINRIVQSQDENGHNYLSLIESVIQFIQTNHENSYDQDNFMASIYLFETVYIVELSKSSI